MEAAATLHGYSTTTTTKDGSLNEEAAVNAFDDIFTQQYDYLRKATVGEDEKVYLAIDVKRGTYMIQLERLSKILFHVSGGASVYRYNAIDLHSKDTGFIIGMPARSAIIVEKTVALTDGARTARITIEQLDRILKFER
ncbi:hypothetical protein B484DRAFT_430360 [Ochromonadaceae sp. CCMP2298]|nr:hypothetical protein B484DRAFT_430360 [Ochromonadaceae sp. CCMP2298]